jgi:hypothetical protein
MIQIWHHVIQMPPLTPTCPVPTTISPILVMILLSDTQFNQRIPQYRQHSGVNCHVVQAVPIHWSYGLGHPIIAHYEIAGAPLQPCVIICPPSRTVLMVPLNPRLLPTSAEQAGVDLIDCSQDEASEARSDSSGQDPRGASPDSSAVAPTRSAIVAAYPYKQPTGHPYSVFISHAGGQKHFVAASLKEGLEQRFPALKGRVFLDDVSLQVGDAAMKGIYKSLRNSFVGEWATCSMFLAEYRVHILYNQGLRTPT